MPASELYFNNSPTNWEPEFTYFNMGWTPDTVSVETAGGQTNRNFFVGSDQGRFFVRLPLEQGNMVDRIDEACNVLALSRNEQTSGIVPECQVYVLGGRNVFDPTDHRIYDLPDGAMITSYIAGGQLNGELLRRKNVQEALLKSLSTLHMSGVRFANPYDVFRDEVDKYSAQAERGDIRQLVSPEVVDKIKTIEGEAKEKLHSGGEAAPTHNDLIVENLILGEDGKVYLIDFEYAGQNSRGFEYDLGILLGGNMFHERPVTPDTFESILSFAEQTYGRTLNREQIYYGALTNILVMFWWGVARYCSLENGERLEGQDGKEYLQKYVLDRAQGILDLDSQLKSRFQA